MKALFIILLAGDLLVGAAHSFGQRHTNGVLTMEKAFALAIKNSAQLT